MKAKNIFPALLIACISLTASCSSDSPSDGIKKGKENQAAPISNSNEKWVYYSLEENKQVGVKQFRRQYFRQKVVGAHRLGHCHLRRPYPHQQRCFGHRTRRHSGIRRRLFHFETSPRNRIFHRCLRITSVCNNHKNIPTDFKPAGMFSFAGGEKSAPLLFSYSLQIFRYGQVKVAANNVVMHHPLLHGRRSHVIAENRSEIFVVILHAVEFFFPQSHTPQGSHREFPW